MKRFVAILNDGSFINVPATSMEFAENAIIVSEGKNVVAYVDVSVVLYAHISERNGENNG